MERLADAVAELDLPGFLAEVHEELRDLVRVHAGRRHLDGSRPVEVVVAEVVGQPLNGCLLHHGVVEGDIEVSREHAALCRELRHEVEVVLLLGVLVLNDLAVNERPRGWVDELPPAVLDEEALRDALVHDDDRDGRLLLGRVVSLPNGLAQLVNLLLEHLPSHGIAHTVAVDDEVLGIVTVLLLEAGKCTLDGILQLLVDNLLALLLGDALRVVLAPCLVDGGTEANDG